MYCIANSTTYRVPPFLMSIEDPRAAQGGALKGCPVCGGTYRDGSDIFMVSDRLRRSWSWYLELSKAGGHSAQTDGISQSFRRQRRLLICPFDLRIPTDLVRVAHSVSSIMSHLLDLMCDVCSPWLQLFIFVPYSLRLRSSQSAYTGE